MPPRAVQAAAALLALVALAGCSELLSTAPTATAAAERCIDVPGDAAGLAWSPTGRYLAVGTVDPAGVKAAQVLDTSGDGPTTAVIEREMLPETVVTSVDGQLAWISAGATGRQLVVNQPDGMRFTVLPDEVVGLGWTAIGYALLEHPAAGGSRVLIADIDRPADPNEIHRTDLTVARLWIAADREIMVLSIAHPDHRDAPVSFQVVGAEETQELEPPGADASGASMPALRRWLVYRSASTSRMEAVPVDDPDAVVTLVDRAARRGMISDGGMLAYVPVEPANQVCLVDVAAELP